MSNIDKQALREEFQFMQDHYSDPADRDRQLIYIAAEALLDELESEKERADRATRECNRLLEALSERTEQCRRLEGREINLPPYTFFDFKQGSPFKSGAYCNLDAVNAELSKLGIKFRAAGIGKGE
ncbi:hypothetical protein V7I44_26090 [Citrobacter farmeri]|uniref:hypothetical protein n=1 Tax=Citrobacter farmeri TaxID=67824 RepID=UPI002E10597E